MSFINASLLLGLLAIAIPIILHLLNRRTAKKIEWGAMMFLLDSVQQRKKRIQLEEALLLASRCLLLALVAMAVARPFQPPGGTIPYVVILPAFLLALVGITTGIILREDKRWFRWLVGGGVALLVLSAAAVAYERYWNLKRFGTAGRKDIVLIVDGSMSMQLKSDGTSNFDRALAEAREVIEKSGGGNAFSLILGGPVPLVKIGDPISNKSDLEQALGGLKPMKAKMDGFACLSTALTLLNRGANPNKEIIVFTDQQALGWHLDEPSAWEALQASAGELTTKPSLVCRQFPLPTAFRNIAAAELRLSRSVVGTDRPVSLELVLENTGNEAITPANVELTIDQPKNTSNALQNPLVLKEAKLGQLLPGGREIIRFSHKFPQPGAYVLRAKVTAEDDLALDNEAELVAHVDGALKVLIVEGNPGNEVLQRSSTFVALALAPASRIAEPKTKEKDPKKPGVLLDAEVMPHTRLVGLESLAGYSAVILCDVPKLADSVARRLATWVEAGGGLFIAPGNTCEPTFYNNWQDSNGKPVLPAKLKQAQSIPPSQEPLHLALNTLTHPALRIVADAKQSDLGTCLLQRYWQVEPEAESSVAARYSNGEPFLITRQLGFGEVISSTTTFDTQAGNLATRQAFVPLLHQLVYHLSSPDGQPLQREAALQVQLPIGKSSADGGLLAEYFTNANLTGKPSLVRVESSTSLDWGNKSPAPSIPADRFSARFTGSLIPPATAEYVFNGWADQRFRLTIDGQEILDNGGEKRLKLEAGKRYPIQIDFEEKDGDAKLHVEWHTDDPKVLRERKPMNVAHLQPFQTGKETSEVSLGKFIATGPDGQERSMELVFGRQGQVAKMSQDVVPGVYRLQVPESRQAEYASFLAADGTIPFGISTDATESRITPLQVEELAFLRRYFPFLLPANAQEVTNILAGREFGEELWKYLALGALFILLAEIALSRWIALQRQAGNEQPIDLESRFQATAAFRESAERLARK
jgi:hypothetical protein